MVELVASIPDLIRLVRQSCGLKNIWISEYSSNEFQITYRLIGLQTLGLYDFKLQFVREQECYSDTWFLVVQLQTCLVWFFIRANPLDKKKLF